MKYEEWVAAVVAGWPGCVFLPVLCSPRRVAAAYGLTVAVWDPESGYWTIGEGDFKRYKEGICER